jgi:hypothetical protein
MAHRKWDGLQSHKRSNWVYVLRCAQEAMITVGAKPITSSFS